MPPLHAQQCPACGELFVTLAEMFSHQAAEAQREVERQRNGRRLSPAWQPPASPRPKPPGGRPAFGLDCVVERLPAPPMWAPPQSSYGYRRVLEMHGVTYR